MPPSSRDHCAPLHTRLDTSVQAVTASMRNQTLECHIVYLNSALAFQASVDQELFQEIAKTQAVWGQPCQRRFACMLSLRSAFSAL